MDNRIPLHDVTKQNAEQFFNAELEHAQSSGRFYINPVRTLRDFDNVSKFAERILKKIPEDQRAKHPAEKFIEKTIEYVGAFDAKQQEIFYATAHLRKPLETQASETVSAVQEPTSEKTSESDIKQRQATLDKVSRFAGSRQVFNTRAQEELREASLGIKGDARFVSERAARAIEKHLNNQVNP